jgi:hypothetical protein
MWRFDQTRRIDERLTKRPDETQVPEEEIA